VTPVQEEEEKNKSASKSKGKSPLRDASKSA